MNLMKIFHIILLIMVFCHPCWSFESNLLAGNSYDNTNTTEEDLKTSADVERHRRVMPDLFEKWRLSDAEKAYQTLQIKKSIKNNVQQYLVERRILDNKLLLFENELNNRSLFQCFTDKTRAIKMNIARQEEKIETLKKDTAKALAALINEFKNYGGQKKDIENVFDEALVNHNDDIIMIHALIDEIKNEDSTIDISWVEALKIAVDIIKILK